MRTRLNASEGMILTNGTVYGTMIFLAEGESASTYTQIPIERYRELTEKDKEE